MFDEVVIIGVDFVCIVFGGDSVGGILVVVIVIEVCNYGLVLVL